MIDHLLACLCSPVSSVCLTVCLRCHLCEHLSLSVLPHISASCLISLTLCASNSSSVTPTSILSPLSCTSLVLFRLPLPSLNPNILLLSCQLYFSHHTILLSSALPDTLPSDPLQSQYDSWLSLVDHLNIKAFVNLTLADSVRHGVQHLLFISGLGQCHRHRHKVCLLVNWDSGKPILVCGVTAFVLYNTKKTLCEVF